jgi:hypothetical protein
MGYTAVHGSQLCRALFVVTLYFIFRVQFGPIVLQNFKHHGVEV